MTEPLICTCGDPLFQKSRGALTKGPLRQVWPPDAGIVVYPPAELSFLATGFAIDLLEIDLDCSR